jgi:FAD/FMN-containing dehydrogenase
LLGNANGEREGYDLVGAFVGSEGCFGIALDITVRLSRNPEAIRTLLADFMSIDAAARAVSAIVATGIIPAALEMIDQATIRAVESSIYAAGYPTDAAAALLIELDGAAAGLESDVATVEALCKQGGARTVRIARDETDRARLWQGRKKAFGAMGRISSHLVVQDAVVPRTKLPEVLAEVHAIAERHQLRVCNVFHAGDGNLHPNIAYDASDADETERVYVAMREIMNACVAAGGTITGEHGVGLYKKPLLEKMVGSPSITMMRTLKQMMDPNNILNPGKVFDLKPKCEGPLPRDREQIKKFEDIAWM